MRKRIWLTCGAVLVICALLLLHRATRHEQPTSHGSVEVITNEQKQSGALDQSQAPGVSTTSNVITSVVLPNIAAGSSNVHKQQILTLWQTPIDFYGKVVDERTNPVEGASIQFNWNEEPTESGARTSGTTSDSDGLFSLHGQRGPTLTVMVGKEGYHASRGGRKGFSFGSLAPGQFSPDPHNPVVFVLWKKGQGAELITSQNGIRPDLVLRVPTDNTPTRVDLLQKKADASGQLEISQKKPPLAEATKWSFSMTIPDGGFVENSDEFPFEAPETNYQSTVELRFTRAEPDWTTHIEKTYYIAFGHPTEYGWLRVETDLSQQSVFLKYAINPSGSRNLEPMEPQPQHPQLPPGTTEVIPDFK